MRCCRIRGTITPGATVTATLMRGQTLSAHVEKAVAEPPKHGGPYEVTPTNSTQVIPTSGLLMTDDFKVNPIPSNYGLITWDGSTLMVS